MGDSGGRSKEPSMVMGALDDRLLQDYEQEEQEGVHVRKTAEKEDELGHDDVEGIGEDLVPDDLGNEGQGAARQGSSPTNLVAHLNYLHVWCRPAPRQRWVKRECGGKDKWVSSLAISKEHRAATPSDLVLDLVYVVLLAQLGRAFRTELHNSFGIAFRDFCALFIPIWCQWNTVTTFLNRFEEKDIIFSVYFIGNVVLLSMVGISAERCGSATVREGCAEFSWAFAGSRCWTILYQVYTLSYNPAHRAHILSFIIIDSCVALSWIVTGLMPAGESCGDVIEEKPGCWAPFIFFWWLSIMGDLMKPLAPVLIRRYTSLITKKEAFMPFNLQLPCERHELFIIISIGEIVAASLASEGYSSDTDSHDKTLDPAETPHSETSQFHLVPLIALIVALVKITYFDIAEHPEPTGGSCTPRKHAIATSPMKGIAFIYLHLPLNICIVLLGSVLEPLKLHGKFDEMSQRVTGATVASIILCCTMFDVLHSGGGVHLRSCTKQQRVGFHFGCMATSLLLPFLCDFHTIPVTFLVLINIVLVVNAVGTFIARYPRRALLHGAEVSHSDHDHDGTASGH